MTDDTRSEGFRTRNEEDRALNEVVVGINGTEKSWRALMWAIGEARRRSVGVVAVFVSRNRPIGLGIDNNGSLMTAHLQESVDRANSEKSEDLQHGVSELCAGINVKVDFVHVEGDFVNEFSRVAISRNAAIVVIGKPVRSYRLFSSSFGRRLLAGSTSPVIVLVS